MPNAYRIKITALPQAKNNAIPKLNARIIAHLGVLHTNTLDVLFACAADLVL